MLAPSSKATIAIAGAASLALFAWQRAQARLRSSYTSIDAASDPEVVRDVAVDEYEGTALGTARHRYCATHSSPLSSTLEDVAARTRQHLELPQMLSSPLSAHLLQSLIRASRATRVLEIGTYTGYTAIAMAEALPPGGRVVCLDDFSDEPAAEPICRAAIAESPCGSRIELRKQSALTGLRELASARAAPFDLCFIDADKESQIAYVDMLLGSQASPPLITEAGSIVVDNTLWYSRVLRPATRHDGTTAAIAAFNEHVLRDERLHVTMLPIRDGLTILQPRRQTNG